jgi:hypothetical protein
MPFQISHFFLLKNKKQNCYEIDGAVAATGSVNSLPRMFGEEVKRK